jgi:hypothetical protein
MLYVYEGFSSGGFIRVAEIDKAKEPEIDMLSLSTDRFEAIGIRGLDS